MYVYTGHLLCGEQALGTYLIVCNVYCRHVHKVILEFVPLSVSPSLRPLVLEIAEVFQCP